MRIQHHWPSAVLILKFQAEDDDVGKTYWLWIQIDIVSCLRYLYLAWDFVGLYKRGWSIRELSSLSEGI